MVTIREASMWTIRGASMGTIRRVNMVMIRGASMGTIKRTSDSRFVRWITMGIRREDKSVWEARAPLAPSHLIKLKQMGVNLIVQPSNTRIFSDAEYEKVSGFWTYHEHLGWSTDQ